MTARAARWAFAIVAGTLVLLTIVAAVGSRTSVLRQLVIDTLSDRLASDVELTAFSVDTFPTVRIAGEGLVVRHHGRRDVPPLVQIDSFRIEGGIVGLLTRPRRFSLMRLDGLKIAIPPGGVKGDQGRAAGDAGAPAPESAPPASTQTAGERADGPREPRSPIIIETLLADDATLTIVPRKAGKDPKVFAIHRLELDSVGVAERIPFKAQLTNPVPRGFIDTSGTFGPWQRGEPGATPLDGTYVFQRADLSTIKGIAGMLDSTGEFSGELQRIAVKGETDTKDFRLGDDGNPVPLTTTFAAVVDGTDGDTYLDAVDATLGTTPIAAKGAIAGTPGVKGRTIAIDATIDGGRIEDLLRLAVKSKEPLMTGAVGLVTNMKIPPGDADVVEKLELDGRFDLESAKFTDPEVRSKLSGMSQRARGRDPDARPENVVSDLQGRFRLRKGALRLSGLTFAIPGATVKLDGTYGLRSEQIEFDGTLRMQATISEAAGGGIKSMLLKAIDPLFRKGKAGAVVPIKVRGTRDKPKFGVDVMKAITPK